MRMSLNFITVISATIVHNVDIEETPIEKVKKEKVEKKAKVETESITEGIVEDDSDLLHVTNTKEKDSIVDSDKNEVSTEDEW